jgi:hypothetical protein
MGAKGRLTVEESFSVESTKHLYLKYINELIEKK